MSSTNRGATREKLDQYYTPSWVVRQLSEAWEVPKKGQLVEPAVGRGAVIRGLERWGKVSPRRWVGFDLERQPLGKDVTFIRCDFLKLREDYRDRTVAAVVSNTPWTYAAEFIYQSRRLYPNAEIVNLLRLGFLAGKGRAKLYREIGAPDLLVSATRPSFTGAGTDSTDYAWFIWPAKPRKVGRITILPYVDRKDRIR